MPAIFKNHNAYSRMELEDPEDKFHRRAQFLIYKTLQEADAQHDPVKKRKSSYIRIKFSNLKIKIGKRLKKLRNSLCFSVSLPKIGFYRQVVLQLKTRRKLLSTKERSSRSAAATALTRPLLTA